MYNKYKAEYMQKPISLLTSENLHALELHCEKQVRREVGQRVREHEIVLELIHRYKEQQEKIEKQEKENIDLVELAEYMLAQIQAIPTFTTWEEYTTWVSKEKIRETLILFKNVEKEGNANE